ncbi:MAG: hypothetical protein QXN55_07610, partial [Candidatus Nitrosotenuis sp.]
MKSGAVFLASIISLSVLPVLSAEQLQVISIGGKDYPASQFKLSHPDSGCDFEHLHANTGTVTALDGTTLPDPDPTGCGFGPATNFHVITIEHTKETPQTQTKETPKTEEPPTQGEDKPPTIFGKEVKTEGQKCGDKEATIIGTTQNDILRGTEQDDVILGLAGD